MLSLRLRQPLVRIASFSRAFSSGSDEQFAAKLKSKLEEQNAALDEIIQDIGPIRAAKRANEEEDAQLMFRSFMACKNLMPPQYAEPLTLDAWKLDQAAGREFTRKGRKLCRTVTVDNVFAIFEETVFSGLVSAIYEGTEGKTLELIQNGTMAKLAQQMGIPAEAVEGVDNAGMLLFRTACRNDEVGLLQAFYKVSPNFSISEQKPDHPEHFNPSSSAQAARELGGIKCASWLANSKNG